MTRPIACMNAYTVVGPTKDQPRLFRSLESAVETSVDDWISAGGGSSGLGPGPEVVGQRAPLFDDLEGAARIVDRRADLPLVANDPGIGQQSFHVFLTKPGDSGRIESGEPRPEALPLAQDREPGETRLEALETDLLEEPVVVRDRPAPLVVVVIPIDLRLGSPPAARDSVVADDQVHGRTLFDGLFLAALACFVRAGLKLSP